MILPGRLYRTLPSSIGRPVFGFFAPSMGLYDDDISSVTITRGADQRGGGITPSVMEIVLPGSVAASINGDLCRFFIREVPAERLATHLGGDAVTDGPRIAPRFQGRVATTSIDDQGDTLTSTVTATSYTQQMLSSVRATQPSAGHRVDRVLNDAFGTLDGSVISGITFEVYGDYDRLAISADAPLQFRDAVEKYAADPGILIRETRDGRTQALPSVYRRDLALGVQLQNMPPLTRSQVLTPATWDQSNEQPGLRLNYSVTNAAGAVSIRTAEVASNVGMVDTESVDWTHFYGDDTQQTYLEALGRVLQRSARQYRLQSITVDLLHLIASGQEYHHMQALNLLSLEVGDPIYLSGDWHDYLDGVHFAQQIRETITGNSWTLELALHPISHVLGSSTPAVPARIWNSARYPWDTESRVWQDA